MVPSHKPETGLRVVQAGVVQTPITFGADKRAGSLVYARLDEKLQSHVAYGQFIVPLFLSFFFPFLFRFFLFFFLFKRDNVTRR